MPNPSTPSLPATSLTLTARRLRRLCRPHPSASLRSPSAPPSRFRVAGAGFARLRLPHPPLLRCPHHRQRHYPRLRSLALPPHSLPQQGGMVRASSFNPIPPCYIPSPSRLAAFGAFAALTPSASLRSPSAPPSHFRVAGAGFARLRLPHPPLLRCPHHRQRHYPRLRSLALPPHSLPQQGAMVRAPSFNPIPPCYIPSPSRLAAFAFAPLTLAPLPLSTPPPRSARRRRRRPASASPVRASPASGFRIPPCSDVRTTASATTLASGRWRSLRTSFPNKAAWSMPHPSTPSLPATSPTLTARRLRRLCRPQPLRLAPLRRLRRPTSASPARASPASGFRIPPCPGVRTTAGATTHASGRWRSLRTPFPNKAPSSMPILQHHPSLLRTARRLRRLCRPHHTAASATTVASGRSRSLRTPFPNRRHGPGPILQPPPSPLHPLTRTARRLRRLCRPQPLRLAPLAVGAPVPLPRRRCGLRPPPASASPPAPISTPPRAPPVAGAPSTLPSPTRRHGPGPILQPHPSLLHPLTLTARRLRRLCRPHPRSARRRLRRPTSASRAGFARLRFRIPPCLPAPSSHRRPTSASPARASPASGFRIPPCPGVRSTTALRSFGSDRHSVAVPAPFRRSRRRRFPLAHTLGFSFLTAGRACGLHTTGSRRFGGSAALPPHPSCAIAASPHAASFRHRSSHHHRCP